LNVKGDYVNTAPARYTLVVLSLAGLTVFPLTPFAAFSPEDAATIQTALAGKAVVEGALVPRGFAKVAEAKGDLDGDGTDDVALIVRRDAEKKGAKAPFAESDGVPQAVLIFSGNKSGKYTLWKLGASHFMDGTENLMEEGGVGIFQIKKGVLTMASDVSMSMGGWDAGGCTLKWRNGPAGFQLIGLTVSDIDRKCACGTTNDTNYLTGLTIHASNRSKDGDQSPKEKVKRTRAKPQTILWESFDFDKMCSS
jgi:hypothetical protein